MKLRRLRFLFNPEAVGPFSLVFVALFVFFAMAVSLLFSLSEVFRG